MSDDAWLAATWPFVRKHLPSAPAGVLELGCGPLGGFVPRMRAVGYEAMGVDPEAPTGPEYTQGEFEDLDTTQPLDALVACTSLHHVADLDSVLDRIELMLKPGGTVVVVEWAHERFDQATARWCFDRLPADGDGWLHDQRDHWRQSGRSWDEYYQGWIGAERLHPARDILRGLQARFDTDRIDEGPYFFAELDAVTSADEQAAIDADVIQAACLRYVGRANVGVQHDRIRRNWRRA